MEGNLTELCRKKEIVENLIKDAFRLGFPGALSMRYSERFPKEFDNCLRCDGRMRNTATQESINCNGMYDPEGAR